MAQRIQTLLIDDLDGGDADETVTFALDGRSYEIDLTTANADRLRGVLDEFVKAARRANGGTRAGRRGVVRPQAEAADAGETAAIRSWAKEQGMTVNDRGRVSREIRQAYEQRNQPKRSGAAPAATFQDGTADLGSEQKKTVRARAAKAAAKK